MANKDKIITAILLLALGYGAYRFHADYIPAFFEAMGTFLACGLVYVSYMLSRKLAQDSKSSAVMLYSKGLVVCLCIAYAGSRGMGIYYDDVDPLFGGGIRSVEHAPTAEERARYFWWAFFILAFPVMQGIFKSRENNRMKARTSG